MRVLQVATDTDRRGAQVFAAELAPVLADRGLEVRTVALAPGSGKHPLPFPVLGPRRRAPSTLRALRRAIRQSEVVVGFGSTTLPACALASLGTGVPFIYRSIGDLRFWADTRGRRARVRHALGRARAIVALWPAAADTIVRDFGIDADRVLVIPRGVDPEAFAAPHPAERAEVRASFGLPDDAPVAAVVGSLSPEKAVSRAIAVAAAMRDVHLLVAGDGPLEADLRREAARSAPDRVHFLGRLAVTRPVYVAADVLLLPSLSEGVPGVVIEAGLCGCPAVATDVGGTASVIDDGVTGRLVPVEDPAALASAFGDVLARSQALGRSARENYRTRFTLEVVGERWSRLLLESGS